MPLDGRVDCIASGKGDDARVREIAGSVSEMLSASGGASRHPDDCLVPLPDLMITADMLGAREKIEKRERATPRW